MHYIAKPEIKTKCLRKNKCPCSLRLVLAKSSSHL